MLFIITTQLTTKLFLLQTNIFTTIQIKIITNISTTIYAFISNGTKSLFLTELNHCCFVIAKATFEWAFSIGIITTFFYYLFLYFYFNYNNFNFLLLYNSLLFLLIYYCYITHVCKLLLLFILKFLLIFNNSECFWF